MSEPIVFVSLPEVPPASPPTGNPRDVAELFQSLRVEHLRYREFQLPPELPGGHTAVFDKRGHEVRWKTSARRHSSVPDSPRIAEQSATVELARQQSSDNSAAIRGSAVGRTAIAILRISSFFGFRRWDTTLTARQKAGNRDRRQAQHRAR